MNPGIHINGLHRLPHPSTVNQNRAISNEHGSFKNVLQNQLHEDSELKISKHAEKRLHKRDVDVTDAEWNKITEKVEQAQNKGVNDAIVLTDNAALVVSAENNTVITAMTRDEAADHIFTNINGTIIV